MTGDSRNRWMFHNIQTQNLKYFIFPLCAMFSISSMDSGAKRDPYQNCEKNKFIREK